MDSHSERGQCTTNEPLLLAPTKWFAIDGNQNQVKMPGVGGCRGAHGPHALPHPRVQHNGRARSAGRL